MEIKDISVGMKVVMRDERLSSYVIAYQKKISGRLAIVDRIVKIGGSETTYAYLTFLKRGNRGKEFTERFTERDIKRDFKEAK